MAANVIGIVGIVVGIAGILLTVYSFRREATARAEQRQSIGEQIELRNLLREVQAELEQARAQAPVHVGAPEAPKEGETGARPVAQPAQEGAPPGAVDAIRAVMAKHGSDRPTASRLLQLAGSRSRELTAGAMIAALDELVANNEVHWDGQPDSRVEPA